MFWRGKKVFLTGHTGFKGAWLSLWLQTLGTDVTGYSLEPPTSPSLFETASAASGMLSILGDVRDLQHLKDALAASQPQIVLHLAAQSLVRTSYMDPIVTYATNVMGTAHLLEAVRATSSVAAVVVITTDKCYDNLGTETAYQEDSRLGGHDPYSSSKACAELVVSAYRSSFFDGNQRAVAVASVRAGNVIGGGDWAQDRLIPDIVRAVAAGEVVKIRNPHATRPWQHVLEPLRGYLMLAEKLYEAGPDSPARGTSARTLPMFAPCNGSSKRSRACGARQCDGKSTRALILTSTKFCNWIVPRRHSSWAGVRCSASTKHCR